MIFIRRRSKKMKTKINEGVKTRKRKKINSRMLQLYSLIGIPVALVILFSYIPMFGIIIAFKDFRYNKGIFGSEWVGLENFKFFFQSNDFIRITRNTLLLNASFIIIGVLAAVTVAIMLFKLESRRSTKIFQTTMITPHFLSWVVVSYMGYAFLNPRYGFINTMFGLNVDWYAEPNKWPFILNIASLWKHVGMDCILYYAALMGMDHSLIEAAEVDGANSWQKIINIMIPTIVPILTINIILKIGGIFRADFGLFYQLTRNVGELYSVTDVIDTYIFRTMRVVGDMGLSSAVGLVQSIVGFILVMITNAIVRKVSPENSLI